MRVQHMMHLRICDCCCRLYAGGEYEAKTVFRSSTGGSRTRIHQGLSLVALPRLAYRAIIQRPRRDLNPRSPA